MKNQHSTLRVHHFFDVYTKTNCLKKFLGHSHRVIKGRSPYYGMRRLITNSKQRLPAPFIRNRNTIFI